MCGHFLLCLFENTCITVMSYVVINIMLDKSYEIALQRSRYSQYRPSERQLFRVVKLLKISIAVFAYQNWIARF